VSKRRPTIITALKQRVPANARVLVALSGGRDSAVLLHALLHVQRLLSLHIEVCHVNHRLREASDADESFVVEWCQRVGLALHVELLPARPAGENLEAWARHRRYEAFKRVMAERELDTLLTAHNANDVAETLLMRLVANKELTSIEEFDPRRRVIRPLIEISREQIDEYVTQHALTYVEDPSNQDTTFVRNRVRHEIIPLLAERFDPSIVWILSERARSLAADSDALHELALEVARSIGVLEEGSLEWLERCRARLQPLATAMQWRVVQILFTPLLGFTVGESRAKALTELVEGKNTSLQMGAGLRIEVGSQGLRVERAD
jgi:tRNA(Ile)-lysidine synthetase-like protein